MSLARPQIDIDETVVTRLTDERRILREAIESTPLPFAVYDPEDRLMVWNDAYRADFAEAFEMFGDAVNCREVSYTQLVTAQLETLMPPEDVRREVARRLQSHGTQDRSVIVLRQGDRMRKVHKFRLPSGALALMATDISELVAAQKNAEAAARSKADFLAQMSHEVRTPMNGILGVAALLDDTNLDQQQREWLDVIRSSGAALLGIINEILDFSRMEAGKEEVLSAHFDLAALLRDVGQLLSPIAKKKNLDLIFPGGAGDWRLGDGSKIRQCVTNLLGNAIKFTEAGCVSLEVGEAKHASADGVRMTEIRVRDTGPGVPEDQIETLFTAYSRLRNCQRRQAEGTGLGLAITHRLSQMMGGEMEVRSRIGEGSTFILRLPLERISIAGAVNAD